MGNRQFRDSYDIVIIGAGPAGLSAGLRVCREKSLSVLLVDKMKPWEHPIPCAEGVGRLGFHEALEVNPKWIRHEVSKALFHAPDGSTIAYTDRNKGYIIDRAGMQSDLASKLDNNGVQCAYGIRILDISPVKNELREVSFANGEKVKARAIIDASGPSSKFGKAEKICWKAMDLEPAYFVHVNNIDIPTDTVHLYVSRSIAPGGYAWVFPRNTNEANIGLLVGKSFRSEVNIRKLLDDFLVKHFPGVSIVQRFAGSIPCGYQRGTAAIPGLIKSGDAASTINPISRAGIVEALMSGALAGEYAIMMTGAENERDLKKICRDYETAWYKKRGCHHLKLARVKNSLYKVPDEDYNKAAQSLSSIPREELTMSRIFKISLGRFPRLVWAMRHLM